jgi:hypothetical protein
MVDAPHTGSQVEIVHNIMASPYWSSQLALITRPAAGSAVQAAAPVGAVKGG